MDQRERVVAMFDRVAETYDRVGVDQFQPIAARLVAELEPQAGERVVDMGCGRGAVLLPVAVAVGPTGHATGLDLAPKMVAAAAEEAARAGLSVDVVVGDAQEPDLPEQSFDALASSLVLFFLPDPAAALRAWRELLVDGGRIAVSTFGSYSAAWGPVDAVFGPTSRRGCATPGPRARKARSPPTRASSDCCPTRDSPTCGRSGVRSPCGSTMPIIGTAGRCRRASGSCGTWYRTRSALAFSRAGPRRRTTTGGTMRTAGSGSTNRFATLSAGGETRGTPLSREPPATSARSR